MSRVLSAAVLIAILLGTLWLLPAWATVGLAAIAAAIAAAELGVLCGKSGVPIPLGLLATAAAVVCVGFTVQDALAPGQGANALALVLFAVVVVGGAQALAGGVMGPATFTRAAVSIMAPLYVGLPLGALAALRAGMGPRPILLLLAIVAVSDTAQYYTGRLLGRRKLAPSISPGKTVEGALGGLIAAAIVGMVLGPRWIDESRPLGPTASAVLAVLVAGFGIVGDLFESLLKRSAGVKDSGTLIPGHGGMLDRLDSYLFATPAYYVAIRHVIGRFGT